MIAPSYWIREAAPTIALSSAADLESQPSAAFELARAPDGLPLVLHVQRRIDVRTPLRHVLREPLPRDLERALDELDRLARAHSVGLGITRTGGRAYYVTARSIASHVGPTLLARVLGEVSPMVLPEDVAASREPERFASSMVLSIRDVEEVSPTSAVPRHGVPTTGGVTFGRDARLWIGLSRDTPHVAAPEHAHARHIADERTGLREPVAPPGRRVSFESLAAVRSARWHIRARHREAVTDGRLAEQAAYVKALATAEWLGWSISRVDAAKLVAELARSVDREWHGRRRVHGDLKPGNVLLDEAAIRAFDALDVPEGELSPGVTEGWAAPEQILGRPLAPATDVFALGLMVAAVLSAAVYGEEHVMVVPSAGRGRMRLRMMKDPEVWLDPAATELPTEARLAWRAMLMGCLAFDPARRPARGSELADRIDELLSRWDVPGRLRVACGPGRLDRFVGSDAPVWVLDDAR